MVYYAPISVNSLINDGGVVSVFIVGKYAYVADNISGLHVFDLTNPADPIEVGNFTGLSQATTVIAGGNYVYVAQYGTGISILDVSIPSSINLVGSLPFTGNTSAPTALAISGSYIYATEPDNGAILIIDVSKPAAPALAASYLTSGYPVPIAIEGHYAYVGVFGKTTSTSAIDILDISNPTAPTLVGAFATPEPDQVVVSGKFAYVADQELGLRILDISNPSAPTLVGHYAGHFFGVHVDGTSVFVTDVSANTTNKFIELDATDPTAPKFVGSVDVPYYGTSISSNGNYAYVTDGVGLLTIRVVPSVPVDHPPQVDAAHSVLAGNVTELPLTTGSNALDHSAGAIAFIDADLSDRPSASIINQSVTYHDALGSVDSLTATKIAAFEGAFSIASEVSNTNLGKIDWTFNIADSQFDFLGVGESLTITSTIQVDDHHGGSINQDVAVTINGTDDAPVALVDIVSVQKGTTVTLDAAHGVLSNDRDADIHDVLHVSAINGVSTSVGHVVVGAYGALTLQADGSYSYAVNKNAATNAQDVFNYSVDDGHGGIVSSTVSFATQKETSHQVSLPFSGNYQVTQGPDDKGFGDHTGFAKWSYDFNLAYDQSHHIGTPVLSVGHGTIVDLREYVPDGATNSMVTDRDGKLVPDPLDPSNGTGNVGNYVTVQLDDGTYVTYLHLGQNEISVSIGQQVNAGDVLAFTGLTGARTGPHLHIQFGTAPYHSLSIANNIANGGSDAINGVQNILAGGSGDKTAPENFSNLAVHLVDGANNLYNAGLAAESFVFQKLSDGGYTINGYQHGMDNIDVSALDANSKLAGDQAFLFGGQNAKTVPNSLTWYEKGSDTIIQADVNGDTTADFTLKLAGINLHLSTTDFLL